MGNTLSGNFDGTLDYTKKKNIRGPMIYTITDEDFESIDNFFETSTEQYLELVKKIAKHRSGEKELDIS